MAWYQEWFGEEYLDLYANRDDEEAQRHVAFFDQNAAHHSQAGRLAVLDLACGTGRHTAALRKLGYRALGMDLSKVMLAQARGLPRVNGDMRCLPFADDSFDWVVNFFTSFGYFESDDENRQVLTEIARVVAPGGGLLMDLFNRDYVVPRLVAREQRRIGERDVEIERWFDPDRERINKRIRIRTSAEGTRSFIESVRAYRPPEVLVALDRIGFDAESTWGSFAGDPFADDSPRFIVIARRRAEA